jgi:thiol-disulfide isomerase/thioredoxin
MRIDPKYFNLFVIICAVIALIIITLSTIRYSQKQVIDFQRNISDVEFHTLKFRAYLQPDSLTISEHFNNPVVIHFWSTWSGKSHHVNTFLSKYRKEHPELIVFAAAVRDGDEQIEEYIKDQNFNFIFVEGTSFYQQMYVPGIPSQILIDKNGQLYDIHIGDETMILRNKLDQLMQHE